jgi:hypothetical protein
MVDGMNSMNQYTINLIGHSTVCDTQLTCCLSSGMNSFFTAVMFGCTVLQSAGSQMCLMWRWVWINPLLKAMSAVTLLDW